MNVREAEPEDQEAISEIAQRSLEASYTLSPQTIESAVTQWYDPDEFDAKLDDDDILVLVAERDGGVLAFTESQIHEDDDADAGAHLLWLHVHPDHRGSRIGEKLFDETRSRLTEAGVTHFRGRVLSMNEAGNAFFRSQGFEKIGEDEIEIDGSPYTEALYVEAEPTGLQPVQTDRGDTVYVDHEDVDRGSLAPFHVVYTDDDRSDRYGYFCSKCESLANAMDAMGRIECGNCGNSRKPLRWDAAYM